MNPGPVALQATTLAIRPWQLRLIEHQVTLGCSRTNTQTNILGTLGGRTTDRQLWWFLVIRVDALCDDDPGLNPGTNKSFFQPFL